MRAIRLAFILWIGVTGLLFGQPRYKTKNVILITLDGMRWQEIFSGAEHRLISHEFVQDSASLVRDFWGETPEVRRSRLMPFLWTEIAVKGQLLGNRQYGNFVNVTNRQWFSYPGYNELLCGFADYERIHSNDKFNNPNQTILEYINNQPVFKGKVVAYTSWDVFPFIINAERSGIRVNSGLVTQLPAVSEREKLLNDLMFQVPNPLGDVRLDAFTYHYAFEYLRKNKPRLMYLSFDETDDFAHQGKYEWYLRSAHYTDFFIRSIWNYCQSDPQYRGSTTLIITCDHGRGNVGKSDWRDHGISVPGADQIWMAIIGPDTPGGGERRTQEQHYQNQLARTIVALLGLQLPPEHKAGNSMEGIIKR